MPHGLNMWDSRALTYLTASMPLNNDMSLFAVCTFGVGLLEQLGQVHNETITLTLQRVCELFGDVKYRSACDMIVQFIGPKLVKL